MKNLILFLAPLLAACHFTCHTSDYCEINGCSIEATADSGNPYCNLEPVPLQGPPNCPEGSSINQECVEEANARYLEAVRTIYNFGCVEWWSFTEHYKDRLRTCVDLYARCLNRGGSYDHCRDGYNECADMAEDWLSKAYQDLDNEVSRRLQAATDAYWAALADCCE
jgi:hypothetical protein